MAARSKEKVAVAMETQRSGRQNVFAWWDYPAFACLSALSAVAIAHFLVYWFTRPDWPEHPLTYTVLTLILLGVLLNHQGRWYLLLFMRNPPVVPAKPGWRVAVVTTFVPGSESIEMLRHTLKALVRLDYPHDTWVLDEGDAEEVRALCQSMGANHFSRKNRPEYNADEGRLRSASKPGNYNAWLTEIGYQRYDVLTALDPDHVLDAPFLSSVLGYFDDPAIGYVQAPQAYYNHSASFIARGAAEESYGFYSYGQMACYGLGSTTVIGSHNTHRLSALREVGGFADHDADDLMITLLYRRAGWRGVYVPRILARGLAPVDWPGYLGQQRRWARSVLDVKVRILPRLADNLPLTTRLLSLLHGLHYLSTSFIIPTMLGLLALALATGSLPEVASAQGFWRFGVLYAVLQVAGLYQQRFSLDWHRERGLHWRVVLLQMAKWPYVILSALDVLLGRQFPYALTAKVQPASRRHVLLWPSVGVFAVISLAWAVGISTHAMFDVELHVLCAVVLIITVVLLLSEQLSWPAPFDPGLRSRESHEASRDDAGYDIRR